MYPDPMIRTAKHFQPFRLALLIGAGFAVSSALAAESAGVQIVQEADVVKVTINGHLFTEYHYKDVPRPYFYPLIGPDDLPMTRNWPMKDPPGEEHDHPHHRSLWFAHGNVNGVDFWGEANVWGKIVHDGFTSISSGDQSGEIHTRDKWVMPDGSIACTDDRVMRVYNKGDDRRMFDFEITIHASNGDVVFGDTKEGSMALRLAETMRYKKANKTVGDGHIVNSNGVRDDATWGKHADWVDYYGPVNGKIVGVAIFDNPNNPRHPTTWHVRDYGLFAANPFGLHDFEKKPAGAGDFKIPAGQSATFRYRFYMHRGNDIEARVGKEFSVYARDTARETKPTAAPN
jgi:hypothetical protein